jgi:ADP-heptose:LPS heptosyltransferase
MTEERRILLVRMDGLGDALACVPLLEGLRRALPGARFAAVCSAKNADVYASALVQPIEIDAADSNSGGLEARLAAGGYTDAIVATEEPRGYQLARATGARRRVGFWHRFEKTFKSLWQYAQLTDRVYRPAAWRDKPEHEVEALYHLAEPLGAAHPIPREAGALRRWINIDERGALVGGRRTLVVQVSAKLALSGWGPSALAQLLTGALHATPFVRLVLIAASVDQGLARAMLEHLRRGTPQVDATLAPCEATPLWLGALGSAGAIITPDTGAAHAAGMLGVPVVDLFEPDRFEQLSRQWKPWAAPCRCLIKPHYAPGIEVRLGREIGEAAAAAAAEIALAP